MASSRVTKQSGFVTKDQFQQLLETMTAGLNPVKPASTFEITPGQYIIEKLIDYSMSTGLKLWQESTQSLPIKLNITGG